MILWMCIAVRIVANPFSNVLQKILTHKGASPLFIIGATHGLLALACLPILLVDEANITGEFLGYMLICTFLTISGNVLIVEAVKRSDLSVLGPINSYKPVISLIPAIIWLNEIPSLQALSGIALIVIGSYFLMQTEVNSSRPNLFLRFFSDRGIQYRFAALVLSALEAVVLKKAILVSTPLLTFACWSIFGFGTSILAMLLLFNRALVRDELSLFWGNKLNYFLLFITTGLMQLCTTFTFVGFPVGSALALFQISTIIAVVLGWRVFQEREFAKRLISSIVMVLGAVLIISG
jgi:drug/metabolite transporter (DMT)-like permease